MNKKLILDQFGVNADAYVNSEVHARGVSLERLITLLDLEGTDQVLDVATGTGHTAFALASFARGVTATDITPEMLVRAQELAEERGLANVVFETADAGELPYENATFDLVTCRIAAHHFADVSAFVAEAARVVRPGGQVAVIDNIVPPGSVGAYVNAFEKFRDPSHSRCLSLEEWIALFQEAGLTLEKQETLAKRLDFDFWAQRHDQLMQDYLRALLTEAGEAASALLDPKVVSGELSFRLVEGIVIGRKEARSNS